MVCLYCGAVPPPGSVPLGTYCAGCGKPIVLTPEKNEKKRDLPEPRITGRGGAVYLDGKRVA